MTAAEKKTGIDTTTDMKEADMAIFYNFLTQISLYTIGLLIFIIIRKKFKSVFCTNPRKRKRHPAYNKKGFFSWIIPVFSVTDIDLININGLDCYVILSLFRMFITIFFLMSILVMVPLCVLYAYGNIDWEQIFFSLCVKNNQNDYVVYFRFVSVILTTFLVIFILYYYAKSFISLRQSFIRNPATMFPIDIFRKKSFEQINACSKTVLLTRLPKYIERNNELKEYVKALGLGETSQCLLIQDTRKYNRLLKKRKKIITDLEKEIYKVYDLLSHSQDNHENIQDNIKKQENINENIKENENIQENGSIDGSVSSLEIEDEVNEKKISHSQRVRILKALLNDKKYSEIQKKLTNFNENFNNIKNELDTINEKSSSDKNIVQIVRDEYYNDLDTDSNSSSKDFFKYFRTVTDSSPFTLDMPYKTQSGIVTFTHQKSASVLCQALISARLFSASAEPAPSPTDIYYDNINKPPSTIYVSRILSTFAFLCFTIVFFSLVGALAVFVKVDFLEEKIPMTAEFLKEHPAIRSTLSGILTPLTYNILMACSPLFIKFFINWESNFSKTADELSLITKYSIFLLFNGFFSFVMTSSLYEVSGISDITKIIDGLQDGLLSSSVFFTNALIQKIFFGNILFLISIGSVISKFLSYLTNRNTLRQKRSLYTSEILDFGTTYPNIMLIFAICLIYSLITPIVIFIGLIFFLSCLFFYKTKFIYTISNPTESGGIHFNFAAKFVFYILIFFQFANSVNQLKKHYLLGIITFILVILTWFIKNTFIRAFEKATKYYPLSLQEELYIDTFTKSLLKSRIKYLEEWQSEEDKDIIYLEEIELETLSDLFKKHDQNMIYENVVDREGLYIDTDVFIEFSRRYGR